MKIKEIIFQLLPAYRSIGSARVIHSSPQKHQNLFDTVPFHAGARYFLIAAPDVAREAATLQDTAGMFVFPAMSPTGGEMLNVPVLVSSAATAGTLTLVDASGLAGDAESVSIEMSNQADLEMADESTLSATTPTPAQLTSMWATNSSALRASLWFGIERIRPDAVAQLTSIQWGPAVST